MILSPKLFIDACIAKPRSDQVIEYYRTIYPSIRAIHLTEILQQGTCDSEWLPRLGREGGWIAVSADKGKDSTKPKLPDLCREYKVTCVQLSPTLGRQRSKVHMQVLQYILNNVSAIYNAPQGTIIRVGEKHSKGGIKDYEFKVTPGGKSLSSFLAER